MNIKSGMTTDRAFILSARPEFGPLQRELSRAGKEILAGNEIRYALLGMTTRIKSQLFERTIRLILEGIESGGELSSLLQQTAEDIQTTRLVTNEVRSNVLMYAIFIFFAVGFGAPLLFGISTYLVSQISTQFSTFQVVGPTGEAAAAGLKIAPGFLVTFALVALTVSSFFGGLIIGIVKGGSERNGFKFIPLLIVVSFVVFFIVRTTVSTIFPVL
jgi:flagellar protein FlaJ